MRKKATLIFAVTMLTLTNSVYAETVSSITVALNTPHKYNTPMTEKEPKKLYEVSGTIDLNINEQINEEYTVEYYIDGNLMQTTTGESGYNYQLDTTILENGIHKITVNYYKTNTDKPEMLIGTQKIMVKNENN